MKKIYLIIILLATIIFLLMELGYVVREDFIGRYTKNFSLDKIRPDSPFYFIDRVLEETLIFFTFNSKEKLKMEGKQLLERANETKQMIVSRKGKEAKKALLRCEQHLAHIIDKTNSMGIQDKEDAQLVEEIAKYILEHNSIVISVYKEATPEERAALKRQVGMSLPSVKIAVDKITDVEIEGIDKKVIERDLYKFELENYLNVVSYDNIEREPAKYAYLSIIPAEISVVAGEKFNLSLVLDTNSNTANAAEAKISFPAEKLDLINLDVSDSIFQLWVQTPYFSQEDNSIKFAGGIPGMEGFNGENGKLLKLTFLAKSSGEGEIVIKNARVLAADGYGTDLDKAESGHFNILSQQ